MKKRLIRRVAVCLLITIGMIGMSATLEANATEGINCKIIIGDSRTTGIIFTLRNDKNAVEIYSKEKDAAFDSIFVKDNTILVLCSQGGGSYRNGACDRTFSRALELLRTQDVLKNCSGYSFYNLFGFNDVFLDPMNCSNSPGAYILRDKEYADKIGKCMSVYQFNAGPIDESGTASWKYCVTNALVAQYNQGFVGNSRVSVVDLNGYLYKEGYKGSFTEDDDSGIHYDSNTSKKIINLLMTLQ